MSPASTGSETRAGWGAPARRTPGRRPGDQGDGEARPPCPRAVARAGRGSDLRFSATSRARRAEDAGTRRGLVLLREVEEGEALARRRGAQAQLGHPGGVSREPLGLGTQPLVLELGHRELGRRVGTLGDLSDPRCEVRSPSSRALASASSRRMPRHRLVEREDLLRRPADLLHVEEAGRRSSTSPSQPRGCGSAPHARPRPPPRPPSSRVPPGARPPPRRVLRRRARAPGPRGRPRLRRGPPSWPGHGCRADGARRRSGPGRGLRRLSARGRRRRRSRPSWTSPAR